MTEVGCFHVLSVKKIDRKCLNQDDYFSTPIFLTKNKVFHAIQNGRVKSKGLGRVPTNFDISSVFLTAMNQSMCTAFDHYLGLAPYLQIDIFKLTIG